MDQFLELVPVLSRFPNARKYQNLKFRFDSYGMSHILWVEWNEKLTLVFPNCSMCALKGVGRRQLNAL